MMPAPTVVPVGGLNIDLMSLVTGIVGGLNGPMVAMLSVVGVLLVFDLLTSWLKSSGSSDDASVVPAGRQSDLDDELAANSFNGDLQDYYESGGLRGEGESGRWEDE